MAGAPSFEVSSDRAQLGYDAPFSIVAHFSAWDAEEGAIATRRPFDVHWTQVQGFPLRDIAVGEGGLLFSARTPSLAECRPGPLPWGVVPLSPRTRCEVVLEFEWRWRSDEAPERERVAVAAATRSRGLPNVPLDQRLYLGGNGWRVQDAPPNARAAVEVQDGASTLRTDARGIWQLVDGDGRSLRIQAGRYSETPLDCGRAGCHGEIARAAQSSPMTWALARRLLDGARHGDGATDAGQSKGGVACAATCHVTGESGIHDGGFFDIASDLRVPPSLANVRDIAELPRALRRLGSVGCLACHGPSALPEADARWSILRSDVCAHCHDAPPRYGHVVAWQTTSMARADRDPRARSDRSCTPCHTTWDFLRTLGRSGAADERGFGDAHGAPTAALEEPRRIPPPAVGNVGIACPACHAVHSPSAPTVARRLLRVPHLSPMFADIPSEARVRSATCIACHAPRDATQPAQASAAAVWAGRGGIDPETGAPLAGPSPHLSIDGGCVGCHREGPDDVEHGRNHGFRASRDRCASCHEDADAAATERARIERGARDLWDAVRTFRGPPRDARDAHDARETEALSSLPPHATTKALERTDTPVGRAIYDLSLLLEDRGFFAHNVPYARLLLEKAKATIERAIPAQPRSGSPRRPIEPGAPQESAP